MANDKRMIRGYEIVQTMHIGDKEIVIGVDEQNADGLPYMVAYCETNGIIVSYYNVVGSDDYAEIVEAYGQRIAEQAAKTRQELMSPVLQGIDNKPLSVADCTVIDYATDLRNKVIVVKADVLRPEYRKATCQVQLCTGGFGAVPNSRGSAVHCTELYTGRKARYERSDVLGVLEPEQMPKWAKHYLEVVRDAQEKERKHRVGER